MSYFECPHCHQSTNIFSHGGGRHKAEELGIPFLGEIPLELETRVAGDQGKPIVIKAPDSSQSKRFDEIAAKLQERVASLASQKTDPRFTSNLSGANKAFEV